MSFRHGFGRLFTKTPRVYGSAMAIPALASSLFWYSTQHKEEKAGSWRLACGAYCAPKDLPTLIGQERRVVALDCCGEDSFAIAENNEQVVVGMADGVGSWRQKGIDPSRFSRSLMRHLEATVMGESENGGIFGRWALTNNSSSPLNTPIAAGELMKQAFWRLVRGYQHGKEQPFGSSTAVVISLNKADGALDTANLGDSGFLLIRDGDIILRSEAQQHRFNAPYQLMLSPDGNISDTCRMAALRSTIVQAGDVLLVATDGLWDNLFEDEIMKLLQRYSGDHYAEPHIVARHIVQDARRASEDPRRESPFCIEARKHGMDRLGGKMDDITVVVAVAQYIQK